MTKSFPPRPRARSLLLVVVLVVATFIPALATVAQAQDQTGATATKDCPQAPVNDPYTIGDTVTCTATFRNDGAFPATVTLLTETAPFVSVGSPSNGTPIAVSCTLPNSTVISTGGTLPAATNPPTVCTATFGVTIPNDPALCNTVFRDRVDIELEYPNFNPPLTAGAFATHTLLVVCKPTITVTKTADTVSKVGDPVNYTIQVCNTGLITVTKQAVIDSLIGDLTTSFDDTLAPGACDSATVSRTVVLGDPDPLVNTVTATYTAGIQTATATSSATTDLFQPDVDVTKNCSPDPIQIGQAETCTIVVTNTSSPDSPNLENGTIMDTLTGNLLDPGNTAVVNSDCAAVLPTGGSCTINTTRVVLASDPSPLANTVTVHYNPVGFPNDITASATDSVTIETPPTITVTKTADDQSKVGDPVNYTIQVCNTGLVAVAKQSVIDSLLGDISPSFDDTLASGACDSVTLTRTVVLGDPDPLVNTVTATYTRGVQTATATASADTDLFQPDVDVTKNCSPDPIQVGQAETCTILVTNTSSPDSPNLENGTIMDTLTGNLLDPGNTAVVNSDCAAVLPTGGSCTINTTRVVLASDPSPLVNTVTVHYNPVGFPNDITASATDSVIIEASPTITVTKTADDQSKVGDPVNYTIQVCNTGLVTVTKQSVIDSLLGDISPSFDDTLAPGACDSVTLTRTVVLGDPDPLVNTVTATYTRGVQTATAMASADTDLFQPDVDVTKNCSPDPIQVGQAETCTIVVTNTSSPDSPNLENGTIMDTLTGNLLDPGNTAVVNSDCAAVLPTGGSCTINTTRVVLASDPSPLVNTVTVHYNPVGFPNDITASATDSVTITPPGGEGCTPGFWKQSQHFDSWVGFSPTDKFSAVFGVTITVKTSNVSVTDPTLLQALQAQGGGINALARFAVNALLNSTATDSDFTTAQVIAIVADGVNPGGLTIEEAKLLLSSAPGVVNDNCPLS